MKKNGFKSSEQEHKSDLGPSLNVASASQEGTATSDGSVLRFTHSDELLFSTVILYKLYS